MKQIKKVCCKGVFGILIRTTSLPLISRMSEDKIIFEKDEKQIYTLMCIKYGVTYNLVLNLLTGYPTSVFPRLHLLPHPLFRQFLHDEKENGNDSKSGIGTPYNTGF